MRVSCLGSGKAIPAELYAEMRLIGKLLALRGVEIATGAFGGIGMEAPAEGASEAGVQIRVIGYSYGYTAPNPHLTEVVSCELLASTIPFNASYCVRLAGLLSSDAFIVAGGGGPGTFLELVAVINFNQKFWNPMKRTAILERKRLGGWDNSMLDVLKALGVLSDHVASSFRVVSDAEAAVRWVTEGR